MSDEQHPQIMIDLSGVNGTWCLAYLFLPTDERERGLYATAMNFLVNAEGALVQNWESQFPKVVNALRNGPVVNNVSPLTQNKPTLSIVSPDDHTG